MDVTASRVPVRPFLEYSGTLYYGLTVNPANGEVYIADAIDYQQQGMIYRYSPDGELIDEFLCRRHTGGILLEIRKEAI